MRDRNEVTKRHSRPTCLVDGGGDGGWHGGLAGEAADWPMALVLVVDEKVRLTSWLLLLRLCTRSIP
jgi:hypothetical protein